MEAKTYKSNKLSYAFNEVLDTDFLHNHYEDDIEQVYLVFGIFLSATAKEFEALVANREAKDLESLIQKIHKIKPNFLLVGLQDIYRKLNTLEVNGPLIGKQATIHKLKSIYQVYKTVYFPILSAELERLNKILSGTY